MDEFRRSEDILKNAPPTPSPKSMKIVKQSSTNLFPCSMCSQTLQFKSKLYIHYAHVHFRDKLLERFRGLPNCPFCNNRLKSTDSILTHMGSVHNHVEQFLDPVHHAKKMQEKTTSPPEDHVSCYLCTFTSSNKKDLYMHYSLVHFKEQLIKSSDIDSTCPVCCTQLSSDITEKVLHIGVTCGYIENCLPIQHHVKNAVAEELAKQTNPTVNISFETENVETIENLTPKLCIKKLSNADLNVSNDASYKCSLCCEFTTTCHKLLLRHYAFSHFRQKFIDEFGESDTCPDCEQVCPSPLGKVSHLLNAHNYIEKYLNDDHRKEVEIEVEVENEGPVVHDCYICSYKSPIRSRMYTHYATNHFREEIMEIYPEKDLCPLCSMVYKNEQSKFVHLACTHSVVELFLKEEYRIQKYFQGEPKLMHNCSKCEYSAHERHRIYNHYAIVHFKQEIHAKYPEEDFCSLCNKSFSNEHDKLGHLGSTHSAVDLFLEKEFTIPKKLSNGNKVKENGSEKGEDIDYAESNHSFSSNSTKTNLLSTKDENEETGMNSVYTCFACDYSSSLRSRMYTHYALMHFKDEILAEYPDKDSCSICGKMLVNERVKLNHLACVHSVVEKFLKTTHIIPKQSAHKSNMEYLVEDTILQEENASEESVYSCFSCEYKNSLREKMYTHYARKHFKDKILALYPEEDSCAICGKILLSVGAKLVHLASTHSVVDQFLKRSHIIPKRCYKLKSNMGCPENENVQKEKENDQTVYSCFSCTFSHSKRKNMYSHYARKHFKEKILALYPEESSCSICSKIFISESAKLNHLSSTHSVVDLFLKKTHIIPKQRFKLGSDMLCTENENVPKEKENDLSVYSCFGCEYSSPLRKRMYSHYARKHLKDKILAQFPGEDSCSECGTMFINESAKLEHLTSKHNAVDLFLKMSHIIPKRRNNPPSPHKCYICDFETIKRHNIYKHYSFKHYKNKFKQAYNLDLPCHICGLSQSTRYKMIQHLGATHDLVEQFLPKQYHIPQSKSHHKKGLPFNPLQCSKCEFVAKTASMLYQHYALKHFKNSIIKKFGILENCSICDLKFSSKWHQVIHLGTKHRIVENYLKKKYHLPLYYKGKKDNNSKMHQPETSIKSADEKKVYNLIDSTPSDEGPTLEGETFEVYMDIGEESEEEIVPQIDDRLDEEDKASRDFDNLSENHSGTFSGLERETVKKIRNEESDDDTNNDINMLDVPPEDSDEDDAGNCNGDVVLDVDDSFDEEDSDSEEIDIDEGIDIEIDASDLGIQIEDETDLDSDDESAYANDQADMDGKGTCVYLESRNSEANSVGANVVCTDLANADNVAICKAYTVKEVLKEKHAREEEALEAYSCHDYVKNANVVKSKDDTNDEDCVEAAHEQDKNVEKNVTMDKENAATDKENAATNEDNVQANEKNPTIDEDNAGTNEDVPANEENSVTDEDNAAMIKENAPSYVENSASDEENAATDEENSATDEDNAPTDEENAPTDEDNAPTDKENAGTDEENAETDEENVASDEESSATDEENSATDEENTGTQEENTATDEENAATDEENALTDEENVPSNEEVRDDVNKSKKGNNSESEKNKSKVTDTVEQHDNKRKGTLSNHLVSQSGIDLPSLPQRSQESILKAVMDHGNSTVDKDVGLVTDEIYEAESLEDESVKTDEVGLKIDDLKLPTDKDKLTSDDEGMKNIENRLKYSKLGINKDEVESRTNEDGSEAENVEPITKGKDGQEKNKEKEEEEEGKEKAAELEATPAEAAVQFVVKIEPGLRKVIDYREICFIESDTDSESDS